MRFVPVKTAERRGELMVLRTRGLLVRQRTQAVDALRGHATEFGLVVPFGVSRVEEPLAKLSADLGVPEIAREMLALLGRQIGQLDTHMAEVDARLLAMHKANEVSRRLAKVPGIGPITAVSLALNVEAAQFESARHLAAWLGLTPRAHSSGGKQRLGGVSRAGHERLRQLLVVGGHGRDPPRQQARRPPGLAMADAIAGPQAAQARGSGAGQQDRPDCLGDDGVWAIVAFPYSCDFPRAWRSGAELFRNRATQGLDWRA